MKVDISFDFRSDARGKDPDGWSPTLKAYQRYLYSKPLPNGDAMALDEKLSWNGLWFSSDNITHSYFYWGNYQHIISQVDPRMISDYMAISYSIGSEIIFPCYRVAGAQTINQARGCNHRIRDRIDLTLECIRRFYQGDASPLYKCLCGYKSFFDLFVNFKGYVDFFHLQDLVSKKYSAVEFLTWFDGFHSNFPLPRTVEEYSDYLGRVTEFIKARNERIDAWCRNQSEE